MYVGPPYWGGRFGDDGMDGWVCGIWGPGQQLRDPLRYPLYIVDPIFLAAKQSRLRDACEQGGRDFAWLTPDALARLVAHGPLLSVLGRSIIHFQRSMHSYGWLEGHRQ